MLFWRFAILKSSSQCCYLSKVQKMTMMQCNYFFKMMKKRKTKKKEKRRRAKINSCTHNKVLGNHFHPFIYNPFVFSRLERHFMMFWWPVRTHFSSQLTRLNSLNPPMGHKVEWKNSIKYPNTMIIYCKEITTHQITSSHLSMFYFAHPCKVWLQSAE